MQTRILVIEDQEDIASLIALNLKILNFDVTCCHDGQQGLDLARSGHFDALILDIMLPSLSGLEICKSLRNQQILTPILMLTARQSESDRVTGLEIGADDYLTKPFSVLELQARVKALLRRSSLQSASQEEAHAEPQEVICREVKILPLKRKAFVRENEVQLTSKEFDLLLYLAKAPGRVFSREQLLNAVWGYDHSGYEHTVNSHINRLRSKIESDPSSPDYVHTVWGVGYKFSE